MTRTDRERQRPAVRVVARVSARVCRSVRACALWALITAPVCQTCYESRAYTSFYAVGPRDGNGSLAKSICAEGLLMAVTVPEPNGPA